MTLVITLLQFVLVPLTAPLMIGILRKLKAKLQNRMGAPIFQPYWDLWKLMHKDEIVSEDASAIFRYAPLIIFVVTIIVGASVPLFTNFGTGLQISNLLFVVYTLSIGTFFLALAGLDIGSAFGGFGSSREMTLAALAEASFIFSLLVVGLLHGTTDLFTIAEGTLPTNNQTFLPLILAFSGFLIVMLAETAHFPFDNPATHLELTMIHEAMILEYSGKRLALLEWAAANKLVIFSMLGANLFFPIGLATAPDMFAVGVGLFAFIVKLVLFAGLIAVIESSLAKFRFFRLPDLLFTSLIINAVAIILIF